MARIQDLVKAFDMVGGPVCHDSRPSPKSVDAINEHFGISLPNDLIEFAASSSRMGAWLAGLGEDYSNPWHIIRINSFAKTIRRRVKGGGWKNVKPKGFVIINNGFDRDFDCLVASERSPVPGEYPIQYWSPPDIFGESKYPSFGAYIEFHIRGWAAREEPEVRDRVYCLLG